MTDTTTRPDWADRPYDLTGTRILLTGAGGGIGRATARLCATLGADLMLTDIALPADLLGELEAAGKQAAFRRADLRDAGEAAAVAEWAGPVDTLVLNAGAYSIDGWNDPGWDAAFDLMMDTNLKAPVQLLRGVLPGMVERGRGRVVAVGSIVASTGGSFEGVGPQYALSKGGLHTLVRWLANNFTRKGIRANGVAPGVTDTAMVQTRHDLAALGERHPLGRPARPEEIAWPIAFLCSPGAGFISGSIIDVNGGAHVRG
ncbi:SDR family oxidoreductase [Azospirillum sp. RWY-5-1]|uniref:SDR family oxidoreductase n=1 Tax=Azospirillum oleiclasticum TaxID=2735135 RepID=A0ABX2T678_9PROT|nr:SDR family oxidoreductase [Azospirillum oleiclasticum]NYZ11293.1 SDR family oxidoreductase [Azospirillum oleiclasticum]NYZ18454.1 SDR family oxidoreductase [Azospirillum oleiclasticum]